MILCLLFGRYSVHKPNIVWYTGSPTYCTTAVCCITNVIRIIHEFLRMFPFNIWRICWHLKPLCNMATEGLLMPTFLMLMTLSEVKIVEKMTLRIGTFLAIWSLYQNAWGFWWPVSEHFDDLNEITFVVITFRFFDVDNQSITYED